MLKFKHPKKIVAITGASAGVGRATAVAFAQRGYDIGLIARGPEKLESTRLEIERQGVRAYVAAADVSDFEALKKAAHDIEESLGPIDIWVNNAMTSVFAPLKDIEPAEYKRVTDVVYHGSVHGTMIALELMRERDRGHIIQVGSALAYRGIPLQSAYCGAKHAIHGFLDSVRSELLHDQSKIGVSEVHLPAMNTPQFEWVRNKLGKHAQPVPPIFQPEIAAKAIVYVSDHPRRDLWVGWPVAKTVLGDRLVPWFVDRVLAKQGYSGQVTDRALPQQHGDNLFHPVQKDYGAHGTFDDRAKASSVNLWMNMNRRWLTLGGLALAAITGISATQNRRD